MKSVNNYGPKNNGNTMNVY